MKEQDKFIYETPKKNHNHYAQYNNQSTRIMTLYRSSPIKKHREKIFRPKKFQNQYLQKNIFNMYHASFQEQQISDFQVFNLDFCECSNPQQICQILKQTFLQKLQIKIIKRQYDMILQNMSHQSSKKMNLIRKQNLFRCMSKNYPQIFISQLNNLLAVIPNNLTPAEFQCLCWLQYHAHFEYFTYFLFMDLKSSYNNFEKFQSKLNNLLVQTNIYSIQHQFEINGFGTVFNKFLINFYDSVGAKLVPMTAYAQFIKILYQRGHIVLCELLHLFLTEKRKQFSQMMIYLADGDNQGYRSYLRSLNWPQILLYLNKKEGSFHQ